LRAAFNAAASLGRSASVSPLAVSTSVKVSAICRPSCAANRAIALGVVVYPVLIFILASAQDIRNDLGKNIRVIGDISYSTYLLHFPLQLSIMLLIKMRLLQIDFSLRSTWIGFFVLLILVSIPAHYFFERPAQRLIRRSLARERSPPGLLRLDTITM
jgi:peptidoglycan/LPS O-acetylase OafA/YrhL